MDRLIPIDPIQAQRVQRVARGLAVVVAILGAGVLARWLFSVPVLKSVMPGWATMKPNTALAFLLSGAALWLLQRKHGSAGSAW